MSEAAVRERLGYMPLGLHDPMVQSVLNRVLADAGLVIQRVGGGMLQMRVKGSSRQAARASRRAAGDLPVGPLPSEPVKRTKGNSVGPGGAGLPASTATRSGGGPSSLPVADVPRSPGAHPGGTRPGPGVPAGAASPGDSIPRPGIPGGSVAAGLKRRWGAGQGRASRRPGRCR